MHETETAKNPRSATRAKSLFAPAEVLSPQAKQIPKSPLGFVLFFLRQYWWALVPMVILEAGQAACQILIPDALKRLIDHGTTLGAGANLYTHIEDPLVYFIALSLGVLLFSRASGSLLVICGPLLRRTVRFDLYAYLQHHSYHFFTNTFAGSLANRISEVSMSVNHMLWTVLFDFWPVSITFFVSLYLLSVTHSGLALFLGSWIAVYIVVSFVLAMRCRAYAQAFAAERSGVTGVIVDTVTNVMNTKLFARLGFERSRLFGALTAELNSARKTYWFMEKMRWFQFSAALILQVVMIVYALKIWLSGGMTTGEYVMVSSLSLLVINDARGLSRHFLEFFEYLGNITDGVKVMIKSHEVIDRREAQDLKVSQGRLDFKGVSFSYPGGQKVFHNLSVSIPGGQKVGLVGFSGSGKTTFVNSLLRLHDLDGGSICIDGQDISVCAQNSLRQNVSLIPQESMLFHRSFLENIRYGSPHASDEEVYAAAKTARAHDFILEQKDGYQTVVGERGIKLSGGQRQRITIARAILKRAPILVLDEATSSLDSETEKLIQESLADIMRDRTVIVIAHRLSTIAFLDRILVFSNGAIIEDGSHAELLSRGGHYSRLWSMQAGGFLPEKESA